MRFVIVALRLVSFLNKNTGLPFQTNGKVPRSPVDMGKSHMDKVRFPLFPPSDRGQIDRRPRLRWESVAVRSLIPATAYNRILMEVLWACSLVYQEINRA